MKLSTTIFSIAALLCFGSASASELVIYPAQGQSAEQQKTDEGECFIWARNETGIDPLAADAAPPPPAQQSAGGAVGGAARGAIIGGIVDGSDGAKTGAAIGVVGGGMRKTNSRPRPPTLKTRLLSTKPTAFVCKVEDILLANDQGSAPELKPCLSKQ